MTAAEHKARAEAFQPGDIVRYDDVSTPDRPLSKPWRDRVGREFVVVAGVRDDGHVTVWDPEFHLLGGAGDAIWPEASNLTLVARPVRLDGAGVETVEEKP